jgi:hypothetical protein
MILPKEFKWNGLNQKMKSILERMTEWLGIRGCAMKNSGKDYACFFKTEISLIQEFSGHKKLSRKII